MEYQELYQGLYDALFAVRLSLLDSYNDNDETRIIRELKLYSLENDLVPEDQINNLLYNFYCYYDINTTLEEIEQVNVSQDLFETLPEGIYGVINNNSNNVHQNIINTLNTLINGFNIANNFENFENFEDVAVTLDDKELDKLETTKLEEKLNTSCCICMEELDKDDTVTKIKCSHVFHSSCIRTYLEQYNHRCPVCRTELGQVKYNI